MKKYIKISLAVILVGIVSLSGIDYFIGEDEATVNNQFPTVNNTATDTPHGEICTVEIWYPGKFLIVRPIVRIHNRIKNKKHK
jgi:hypothetical protein